MLSLLLLACPLLGAGAPQAASTPLVIEVDGSVRDDTAALQNALNQAAAGPAVVRLAPGRYDFYPPPLPRAAWLRLEHARDVKITGKDAVLVLHDFDPNAAPRTTGFYPARFLSLVDVHGFELDGPSVEMTREPYSTGTVLRHSPPHAVLPWIELAMEALYPDLRDGFQVQRTDTFDAGTRALCSQDLDARLEPGEYTTTVRRMSGSLPVVRLAATASSSDWFLERLRGVRPGTGVVLMHSKYRCMFVTAADCSELHVHDVTVHDIPGMVYLLQECRDIRFEDCTLEPSPGRLLSSTADGINLSSCTGVVRVLGCRFRAMGDDGFNSHGDFLVVRHLERGEDGTARLRLEELPGHATPPIAWSGGNLEFFTPRLDRHGSAELESFEPFPRSGRGATVATVRRLPAGVRVGDLVANPDRMPTSVTIEDCTFEGNIARGVELHGPNLTVAGCTFRHQTGPAVQLDCELLDDCEAPPGNGLTIRDCLIDGCNRRAWGELGAITVVGEYEDARGRRRLAAAGLHRNVRITGNVFRDLSFEGSSSFGPRTAIWITSTDGVHLGRNAFEGLDPRVSTHLIQSCSHVEQESETEAVSDARKRRSE